MKGIFLGLLSASSMLMLASCGKDSDSKKNKGNTESKLQLYGEWEQDCQGYDFLGLSHYADQIKFNPVSKFEQKTRIYGTDKCDNALAELKVVGSYEIVGNASIRDAKLINFKVEKATFESDNPTTVDLLNKSSYCDIKDWKVDKERDITGRDCLGANYKKGMVIEDIYKLEDKRIRFGDASGSWVKGRSAQERPTELADESEQYRRD